MKEMTWGEFKKKLEEHGVKDEYFINYIDFSGETPEEIEIHIQPHRNQLTNKVYHRFRVS